MKKILLLMIGVFTAICGHAQINSTDFVATWNSLSNNRIFFPASGEYTVYYESLPAGRSGTLPATGTFTGPQTIIFPTAGTYRMAVKPTGAVPFHRIEFDLFSSPSTLLTIEQWGSTVWSSFENAFKDCNNLTAISATDAPVLSNVTNMSSAFSGCKLLASAPNIGNWNVSTVTKMNSMFQGSELFNEPLANWDVSSVTEMAAMFTSAQAFNQPIGNWDVSKVTTMSLMFAVASTFNQPLGGWDVSHVSAIDYMFFGTPFNQPISGWDVSSVNNMNSMFANSPFNQPLSDWDVSAVTSMRGLFSGTTLFNQPIGNWDVSAATDLAFMFSGARAFNQPIGNWDVSGVTKMEFMFNGAVSFNQPLDAWDVSKVANMQNIFNGASAFNQPLADWAINSVTNLTGALTGSSIDCDNYSTSLIGWAANSAIPSNLSLDATGRFYGPSATDARNALITKGWSITGDILDPTCAVLPVTLVFFTAEPTSGKTVEIAWQTAQETQNDRFVVERSKDLIVFENIAEVRDVGGNSNTIHTYRAVDTAPFAGSSYYRLVQYDLDGTRTISRIVPVVVRSQDYMLYPNPTKHLSFRISIDEPDTAHIRIHNTSGQEFAFRRQPEGTQTVLITPMSKLVSGTYLITVQERAHTRTFNLMVE
ncbi:BspA family leucine-rich repeat surface protein [Dyadobacter fermentans]|uniref:Lipoprotein n=1 Tax=Dyadobacter fermentans (strain ATCC 700827 / DSM 18053 / CIP 107007 / KCTC 52180 / NS114) TaxID=471854 RepID=C6VW08_DYAFD|nr:BspA family leucine-rich repeat surface protein [Dyadobacter fermentans]ACT93140.1 lipoprotein [Dyadobacter fermentans DSM 18053]